MPNPALLVTGASGQLGRRAIEILLERREAHVIATTRSPDKLADLAAKGAEVRRADFDDEASLARAFQGAERALLVSTDVIDGTGRRIRQQQAAVRALAASGVKHVVYTSLPNADRSSVSLAPDHAATEAALAATALDFTVLRNNVYMDFLAFSLPRAIASGQLVDARGDGNVAYVTREDCARVAAAALADGGARGRRTLDVTGSSAVSSDELAALASKLFDRAIQHVSIPEQALCDGMVAHGMSEILARTYTSFDVAIARGEFAAVTDTVERLTGRPPKTLADFLAENRTAFLAPAP